MLALLLPRLALLRNGLDSQRIWDTNTPAAFQFLQSAHDGTLRAFFARDEKYPLLGSYAFVPVIAGYYGVNHLSGTYHNAADFINAYALGETNVFFWIRLEMLLINLAALWLLYLLAKKYTDDSVRPSSAKATAGRAGLYALVFATVDFYVTLFSVTPRIHSFAFFGTVLVLYASFPLIKNKSLKNTLLAFGAAAIAGALAQSGLPTLIVPILAFFYSGKTSSFLSFRAKRSAVEESGSWLRRPDSSTSLPWVAPVGMTKLLAGLGLFIVLVCGFGYPRMFVALVDSHTTLRSVFLSPEHSQPVFGFRHVLQFVTEYFIPAEIAATWLGFAGFWYVWCCRKRDRIALESYDWLALAHIIAFFLIFGLSDVMTGRFTLAVLPSVFFLLARLAIQLEKKRHVLYPLIIFLLVSAVGVGELTGIAWAHDTRTDAAQFILANTKQNDMVVATMDHEPLGVTPTPDSIRLGTSGPVGSGDARILDQNLIGKKSRLFVRWEPTSGKISDADLLKARYVIVSADHPDRFVAEDTMNRLGFHMVKTFFATRTHDPRVKATIPWDNIASPPYIPLPIALRTYRAIGPTVEVYEHMSK